MPLRSWKTLGGITVAPNRWWTYRKDEYQLPSGTRGEYHYVHTHGASLVVPVDRDGKLHLVNQYRYLCARESIEFPCGGVKEGATYEQTALDELREETGYTCGRLDQAGSFNPYNGVTDEFCRVYIAGDLTFVGVAPDETEEFEQVTLSVQDLDGRIATGEIWDGMTIAAWAIVRPTLASRGVP
ncbi:MAG TPA: NUDIX hydrolase [Bacteroidota bacterium]|nr:NUDIX hydrolase [Bacteroidota bacterium]